MNTDLNINNSNISDITAASIEKYLILKGWQRDVSFKNRNLMVFDSAKIKKRIAIPVSESFDDFFPRLSEILNTIAMFEETNVKELTKEILTSYYNILEFRIVSKMSEKGKLPLSYAVDCIEGLKELILYSACAEENPQPVCLRATNSSKNILDKFELGQTERGSFVINIDSKITEEKLQQLSFDECGGIKPFEYRVVERVHTAFEQVNSIVENKMRISEVTEYAFEKGITANMCEALLKLKPEHEDVEVFTTIRYASVITKEAGKKDCIKMSSNHFWAINEISKTYRDLTLYKDVVLKGLIKSQGRKEYEETTENTINLCTQFDGRYRNIRISLNDNDYRLACNAHRDETEVEVSGELDMSKRSWELTKINYFKTTD